MNKNKILILSPHTDDAELGAGGTISKLKNKNKEILWICFSYAKTSVPLGMSEDTIKKEFLNVVNYFEIEHKIYDFPVRKFYKYRQEILEILIKIRNSFNPDLIIGPSLNDFHQDHNVISHEMVRAFKSSSSIISYDLPWNQFEFNNQLVVELRKKNVTDKLKMLEFYHSQRNLNRPYFKNDFIISNLKRNGIFIGKEYAEVFEIIRWLM